MRTYQNLFTVAMITALLSLLPVCPAYAAWIKSETVPAEVGKTSWWYSTDAANSAWYAGNPVTWQWIDGNKDGVFECYAFGIDGWMFANTITPDGYTVNVDGAWIINGIVQTKYAGWIKSETVPTEAGKSSWRYSTDAANNTWYVGDPVMWQWIDGNKDGVFECYAFGTDGWMFANTITPDGYTVNIDGAWIIDGIVQTKSGSTKTTRKIILGGGSGGGGRGGSSSGSYKPSVKPQPEKPAPIPEKPTPEPEQPEIITYSYTIQYRDIESKEILREEVGQAEKDKIIEIEHRTFYDYNICDEQPTSFQLTYDNAEEIVYYQRIRSASPSEAQKIRWEVNFVDAETHHKQIFPQRSGVVLEGGSLYVNYMPSITIDDTIWEALDTPPFETEVYGPGDQNFYIEFQEAGINPEPEDSYAEEKELLREWIMAAKEAEADITGETPEQILDSRFIISNKTQNDVRVRSITNGISDEQDYTFYMIGRNYIPNGLAITEWYGSNADYAVTAEDTIQIEGDQYTVVRINLSLTSESEHDHQWELVYENPATCSLEGNQLYECKICGEQMEAVLPALGHIDEDNDTICDVCGEIIGTDEPIGKHWNLGDIQVQELDGKIYFFKCIDQNYSGGAENHNQMALFLSTTIVPANYGSQYKYEKLSDGNYDYVFYPGPVTSFGSNNDYKYSKVRKWLNELESDTYNLGNTSIGVSYAYIGATAEGAGDQLQESDLTASYIGDQKMTDQLFILSVDEALKYKEYLWDVESTGAFSKGYWLRSPMGTSGQYKTGYVYIVDLVNENIRAQSVLATGSGSDEEINVTGTTGVRLAYTMPQN
ncbi:hypothetical protein [Lacrimispora amygdalina]|uniref:hypothetical protein n=1 Tax=Lacrimispora amygdalina TaxID=253257 RepID=UPI000BE3DDB4|nr:hypothetical protein [Lacrimispora amygdalina]